jgi:hypothetical protein
MHFMLSLNENFDDNLLQDVVEMIDYSAWFNMIQLDKYDSMIIYALIEFILFTINILRSIFNFSRNATDFRSSSWSLKGLRKKT